jgi:hypothetical protein
MEKIRSKAGVADGCSTPHRDWSVSRTSHVNQRKSRLGGLYRPASHCLGLLFQG